AIGAAGIGLAFATYSIGLPRDLTIVFAWIGLVNAVLGLFNLLPGAPRAGARIVRAVRWRQHGNRNRAMREAGQAGRVIGWGLGGLGGGPVFGPAPSNDGCVRLNRVVH